MILNKYVSSLEHSCWSIFIGTADCLFHNLLYPHVRVLQKIIKLWQIDTSSNATKVYVIIPHQHWLSRIFLKILHQRQRIIFRGCSIFLYWHFQHPVKPLQLLIKVTANVLWKIMIHIIWSYLQACLIL